MPLKVVSIYGTRPEAIKLAPVVTALNSDPRFDSIAITTGQHRDLVTPINELFGISPDYTLQIMQAGQSLSATAARALQQLDPILASEHPDVIVVQGDTTSALAAAIAGFYNRIPIAHVEAGLRSGNLVNPFPEEANRRLVTQISELHLAPTPRNRQNLIAEGVRESVIVVTGNTVIDALRIAVDHRIEPSDSRLRALLATTAPKVLVTTHRRENWGQAMLNIGDAVCQLATCHPTVTFIWPAHPNPTVKATILPKVAHLPNVFVCNPLNYGEFTTVMNACSLIMTDSGGIQEEAPALNKPVIVMRTNTERTEGLQAGTLKLSGTTVEGIVNTVSRLIESPEARHAMAQSKNPYGDGNAATRILDAIDMHFSNSIRSYTDRE